MLKLGEVLVGRRGGGDDVDQLGNDDRLKRLRLLGC